MKRIRASVAWVALVIGASMLHPQHVAVAAFSDANWSSMGGLLGTDRVVLAMARDGSSNLYVGGSFTIAGEVLANRIAKWDGNSWTSLGSGMNSNVLALAVLGTNV